MKKKNETKVFNQTIDIEHIERISEILSENYDTFAHAYSNRIDRNKKKHKFEYYNLLCTCIIRIRETAKYLSQFSFKRENVCGQAFDFYEFINCLSVIFSCSETILNLFGLKLINYVDKKQYFIKSNNTREGDYKFFKFVRSATVAHPDNTSHYAKIAKRNNEVYPYAVWTSKVLDFLINDKKQDADISLLSWASSEKSKYKRYYLYIDEFFHFINAVIRSTKEAVIKMEELVAIYREKHRCKQLKKETDFPNCHEYLMYLRKRLLTLNTNKYEFPDGGLLLADHIILNPIIGKKFKNYLKRRIAILCDMMINQFDEIGFDTIFDELNLSDLIDGKCDDSYYITQKFDSYLRQQACYEIENSSYSNFLLDYSTHKEDPQLGSDAFWAVYRLFSCDMFLNKYKSYPNYAEFSYADIYEMSLELIFIEQNRK